MTCEEREVPREGAKSCGRSGDAASAAKGFRAGRALTPPAGGETEMGEDHRRREGYYESYFRARKPRFLLLVVSLVGLLFDSPERNEPRRGRPPTYPLWRLVALAVIKQVTG
ncbi:MAG: hypothetical protein Q6352_001620, partial [Candidatus Freyrarchaeum guaymaensis]